MFARPYLWDNSDCSYKKMMKKKTYEENRDDVP